MIHPGIDLGTTYSMIAHVNAHGQPALFPDMHDASRFRTPSVVYIGREGCLVGDAAEELLEDAPELPAVRFIKAHLSQPAWRHRDHLGREWSAEALSGLLLRKLLRDADTFAADDVGLAVVTVPAQFTDEQRRATLRAASLAGLQQVRLMEEPVAAAAYYGADEGPTDRTLMVYDFGGGTFDVTLLQTGPDGLFVLANEGLPGLGGRILDERIMAAAGADYRARFGADPIADAGCAQRLRRIAEQMKIRLSKPGLPHVKQSIMLLGNPFDIVLTRAQFDLLMGEAVRETFACCTRCLDAASLSWADVDKILLAGGSSLLPQVHAGLVRISGKNPRDVVSKQPHQAVAFGAAMLAQRLASHSGADSRLRHVSGADVCLRVWDRGGNRPSLDILVPRNTPLPTTYSRTFYTNREDQTRLVLEFVQVRGSPPEESSLGHMSFGPIEEPGRNHPVEVKLALQSDGLVRITAVDLASGKEMARSFDPGLDGPGGHPLDDQRRLLDSVLINA